MFHRLVISVCIFVASCTLLSAAPLDPNVRDVAIGVTSGSNSMLNDFVSPIRGFFFSPGDTGKNGVIGAFTSIAFNIKNFFIAVAVLFLIIGVIKLLFSSSDEEEVKKWKRNIIWVSIGIFVMQIAFSVWKTLILTNV